MNRAPEIPFSQGGCGSNPSLPPRRVRCLPNPAAAELARPWDLGGGDLNFRGIRFPKVHRGYGYFPAGFRSNKKSDRTWKKTPKKTPTLPVEVDDDDPVLT